MFRSKIGILVDSSIYKREYIQEKLNISRGTLSNWCTGKTHPNGLELFHLAELLDKEVGEFYEKIKDE